MTYEVNYTAPVNWWDNLGSKVKHKDLKTGQCVTDRRPNFNLLCGAPCL